VCGPVTALCCCYCLYGCHTALCHAACSYGSAELCRAHCQFLVSILCSLPGSSLVPAYRHLVMLLCRLLPKMSIEHQVCLAADLLHYLDNDAVHCQIHIDESM